MKITNIDFTNFRRAEKKCILTINKQTLIVGKNNTSKTSVIEIITKFLTSGSTFKISDFNYKLVKKDVINELYEKYKNKEEKIESNFPFIEMNVEIELESNDNLALVKDFLYEFDNNQIILIKCLYSLDSSDKIFLEFENYNNKFEKDEDKIDFFSFFERNFFNFYSKKYYSTKPNSDYLNVVEPSSIYSMFNIFSILAQREVDDTSENDKMTLSNAIWKFYQEKKKKNTEDLSNDDLFREAIEFIKEKLDDTYKDYFSELIKSLNDEIVNDDKSKKLDIVSDFDIENLLKKNSKVKYFFEEMAFSESSNGLGYSNLLYIYIQLESFKFDINSKNAAFNLIFLEEPESHLHPQMQSVFLSKINKIFEQSNIYSIITTHSSYILQSSDINNINYFLGSPNGLVIKSLRSFIENKNYSGIKKVIDKYFVINTCDLFFADKVIFIEGMAERILLPYIFEKYDETSSIKISNQHISVFEVGGRHAYIFQDLVNFLELKNLTITDIDSVVGSHNKSCPCNLNIKDIKTTNPTIKNWFNIGKNKLYISTINDKYLKLSEREKNSDNANSLITYQIPMGDENMWGRTLEEQFIIENSEWILGKLDNIDSIKEAIKKVKEDYFENSIDINIENITKDQLSRYCYEIVKEIEKSDFALDIINLKDWKIPNYILEGLEWIAK